MLPVKEFALYNYIYIRVQDVFMVTTHTHTQHVVKDFFLPPRKCFHILIIKQSCVLMLQRTTNAHAVLPGSKCVFSEHT